MKLLPPRMNARICPSGDKAGVAAESVKSVSCEYLGTAGWWDEERYTAKMANTVKAPAARSHHRALRLPAAAGAAGVGAGRSIFMATSGSSGRATFLTGAMNR